MFGSKEIIFELFSSSMKRKERLKWTDDDRRTINSSFSSLVGYSQSINFQRLLSCSVNPLWNCRMTDDGPNTPKSMITTNKQIINYSSCGVGLISLKFSFLLS